MEYIDLRGTSYDSPAVCKYTGAARLRLSFCMHHHADALHLRTRANAAAAAACLAEVVGLANAGNKYYSEDWGPPVSAGHSSEAHH